MRRALAALAAAAACQGGGDTSAPGSGSAPPQPDARRGGGFGSAAAPFGGDPSRTADTVTGGGDPGSDDAAPPRPRVDEPEPPDPGKVLVELGAMPAWQAVVDRTRLLARRGQHGVAYGVLDGAVMVPSPLGPGSGSGSAGSAHVPGAGSGSALLVASPYVWLVDDSDGDGALAIRCQFGPAAAKPDTGARVALGGAWTLDSDRRWIWQVDAVTALPPAGSAAPAPPSQPPGHTIAVVPQLPAGAHTISIAKEGELAYFQLVGLPPAVDGDGWPVADDLGNPVYALLNLPGERASYGAQDMRAPDERWSLRRGVTYIARLGHIHKHDNKPATINARSAVMRLP